MLFLLTESLINSSCLFLELHTMVLNFLHDILLLLSPIHKNAGDFTLQIFTTFKLTNRSKLVGTSGLTSTYWLRS
jgi:hypothetical protein